MMKSAAKYLALMVVLCVAREAAATDSLQDTVASAASVDGAVQTVSNSLRRQGFEIPLVVDHSAAAASVGLALRPTQVVFARPPEPLERSLLRRGSSIAIDLPLKFLIFEDASGEVQLRANPIGYLIDRHDLRVRDFALYLTRALTEQFAVSDDGLVSVVSRRSLQNTVQALQDAIGASGMFRVPLVLDFGEGRRGDGPVLVVFGNPNAGTPLMQATQEIAIDLPQKFLVSATRERVLITYNDPLFVARRANVVGQDERLTAIANALANFAAAGAGTKQ